MEGCGLPRLLERFLMEGFWQCSENRRLDFIVYPARREWRDGWYRYMTFDCTVTFLEIHGFRVEHRWNLVGDSAPTWHPLVEFSEESKARPG